MLSIKFVPQDGRDRIYNLDAAMRCSAEDAAAVARLFKPRPFNTRMFELPPMESEDGQTLGSRLERMLDSPSPVEGELEPSILPKVSIDQKVLLELACQTALSTEYEVKSMLGARFDRDALEIAISHCGLVPLQIVSQVAVDTTVRYSAWLTSMEHLSGEDRQASYALLHGDFHSHVNGMALPSDIDLQGAACLADGRHGDMDVAAGAVWQKWWVALIGNLRGDLYAFLVDAENGIFYSDLPWEVKPTVANPEAWVKSHLGFVLGQMVRTIAKRDVPHGSPAWEKITWVPDDAEDTAPAGNSEGDSPNAANRPAANVPAEPIRRRRRTKLMALAAALLVAVGVGALYYKYGYLLALGESPTIAVTANPAGLVTQVPVGRNPASAPELAVQPVAETPPREAPALVAVVTPPSPVSEPKPTATPPKPVIAPKREPWQEEIVRQNEGIYKAERAPKELDLRAFEGVDPGQFRDWTATQWLDWTLAGTTTADDRMAVPDVIQRAFDDQQVAKDAAEKCKACTSEFPTEVCKGLSREEVRQYCELAPEYRGKNYKPLLLLPVVNSKSR